MFDKHAIPTRLLWVDLETTGLDPQKDVILEVVALVTDFNFKILASYKALIKQDQKTVEQRMQLNNWWEKYPKNRKLFLRSIKNGVPLKQAEQDLIKLIDQYFKAEPAILAGNSIHYDRTYIRHWWPALNQKLHYRMLDVTTLKIIMQGKYGIDFKGKETHRALDDIQESITELRYYLKWLRKDCDKNQS
jgi:oligoribonuclease